MRLLRWHYANYISKRRARVRSDALRGNPVWINASIFLRLET